VDHNSIPLLKNGCPEGIKMVKDILSEVQYKGDGGWQARTIPQMQLWLNRWENTTRVSGKKERNLNVNETQTKLNVYFKIQDLFILRK
jgi:hypothetical protein